METSNRRIFGVIKMTEVLSATQLKRLAEHKYSSSGSSILEAQFQKFWRWLVEKIPMSWAPNAITLVGLMCNVFSCLILCFYSPDGQKPVPAWSLVLISLGLFAYQTLDAIDGKQARRTNSNSPLGELFDHGCDSVSTVFVTVALAITIRLGTHPDLFFVLNFAAMTLYYLAQWQTYVSGTLKFSKFDVTEAQIGIMGVFLLTAALGSDIWEKEMFGVQMKIVLFVISSLGTLFNFITSVSGIFIQGGVGKNGATVADTSVVFPALPWGIVIALATMIYKKSPSRLFQNHPVLYTLSFGMVAAKITNKLVVAHMTKSEMSLLDSGLIGPGLLFFNQYFSILVDEYYVLILCCLWCTMDLIRYSCSVCVQICEFLNIHCFKIGPPDDNYWGTSGQHHVLSGSANSSQSSSSATNNSGSAKYQTRSKTRATTNGNGDKGK